MINGARFPLSCSRSQLRRVRSFLKLQTAHVYHDGKGRQRVAQNLVKSAIRTAKKNVIDIAMLRFCGYFVFQTINHFCFRSEVNTSNLPRAILVDWVLKFLGFQIPSHKVKFRSKRVHFKVATIMHGNPK